MALPVTGIDSEFLNEHDRFLRRLARSLVRDSGTAEDLAQETWLAAVRFDVRRIRELRPWLRKTLHNCLSMRVRGEVRSERRDRASARSEAVPATDELVARLHEHRALLDAVERLAEPYRTTILLRFFEGEPPRVIAKRLQVPVETVRTRLQRGLHKLRESLDQRYGTRAAWLAPLGAWVTAHPSPSAFLLLLMTLHAKAKLGFAALALATGALGIWWLGSGATLPDGDAKEADARAHAAALQAPTESRPATTIALHRESMPAPEPLRPPIATIAAEVGAPVRGRVFTVEAVPLAGVRVAQRGNREPSATTAGDGSFVLVVSPGAGDLVVADPAWRTVLHGLGGGGTTKERILVVGKPQPVTGTIVDANRKPLPGARVWFRLPAGFRSRFPVDLADSGDEGGLVRSGDDGAFRTETCAQLVGASLDVTHDGFRPRNVVLEGPTTGLVVVLEKPEPKPGVVTGRVVDELGRSVEGAFVSGGKQATVSDERGEFVLDADQVSTFARISASKRGMRPTVLTLPAVPEYLVLRLHSSSLTLEGVVVDANGHPLRGAKVWVSDGTFFGAAGGFDSSSEGIAGGGAGLVEAQENRRKIADLPPAEASEAIQPTALWCFTRTDAAGRFVLAGLTERSYRLRAQAPRTLQTVELGPFAAGRTDLRLVIPANGVWSIVRGRVVDSANRPVAHASLTAMVRVLALPIDRRTTTYRNEERDEVTCDADGRFTLTDLPKHAALVVRGDGIELMSFGGEDGPSLGAFAVGRSDGTELEVLLTCAERCPVRVEPLGATGSADEIAFLDAAGQRLRFLRIEGNNVNSETSARLHDGKSVSLDVPQVARTLVVYAAGKELRRVAIALETGTQNVLRY